MQRRARLGALALIATAAVGAAAVATAGAAATAATAPATRTVTASGATLAFSATRLTAPRGPVRLVLRNRSPLRHSIGVRGRGIAARRGRIVGRGGVSRVTVTARPGRYTFFCGVGDHERAGMRGTLIVRG